MSMASSRALLLFLAVVATAAIASGCGGDECVDQDVAVQVSVDGRAPAECANWELQVRACGSGGDCPGACGACVDGAPDPECEPIDACEDNRLTLPPGDWHVCVRAVLVNGGVDFTGCLDTTVPKDGEPAPIAIPVDTADAFPCIRDWAFDGSMCCNAQFGCVPPGS
jgi:hypothetical protein